MSLHCARWALLHAQINLGSETTSFAYVDLTEDKQSELVAVSLELLHSFIDPFLYDFSPAAALQPFSVTSPGRTGGERPRMGP